MAGRPKNDLNKLTKTVKANKKPTKVDMDVMCFECKEVKNSKEFFQSYGTSEVNVAHICKNCCYDLIKDGDEFDLMKFQGLLRKLDRPFLNQIYITSVKNTGEPESILGTYMKNISLPQYKMLTYGNSDFGKIEDLTSKLEELDEILSEKKNDGKRKVKTVKLSNKDRDELIDKWGDFEDVELVRFEKKYQEMSKGYVIHTIMHAEALQTYCKLQTLHNMALEKKDMAEAKMFGDLAEKAKASAKLNPSQLSKSDLSGGVNSFGEIARVVAKAKGIIPIMPRFLRQPTDEIDYALFCYMEYNAKLRGNTPPKYEDIYKFYFEKIEEYNKKHNADILNGDMGDSDE